MATKLFKRTNSQDVFDAIVEDAAADASENLDDATAVEGDAAVPVDETADEDTSDGATPDGEAAADDAVADEPAQPATRKRWLRRVLVGVACVVFIAALALSGFLGWQLKQKDDVAAAGRAAQATAENYAVLLTSIDAAKVDDNFTQVLNGATGEFKDMYSQSASQLRQVLIDNKASSKGIVVDSAVKSATKTKVEVLVFVDQSITNVVNPQPRIDRSRVAITMELNDGRWLASKVDLK